VSLLVPRKAEKTLLLDMPVLIVSMAQQSYLHSQSEFGNDSRFEVLQRAVLARIGWQSEYILTMFHLGAVDNSK
jgi:hypothetical protein